MATENGMNLIRQYSDEGRRQLARIASDPSFDGVKSQAREFWQIFLDTLNRLQRSVKEAADMEIIYEQMRILFRDEISRNNLFFILIGFGAGTLGGFLLGLVMSRKSIQTPIMSAIATRSYNDYDIDLCKVVAPQLQNSNDILIRVCAVSINRIDYRISRGYGRTMRCVYQNYDKEKNPELPLVLGRGCSGIVEGVGKLSRSGLEIGDEVWVASPWYEMGLASEIVVVPETRVQRKPYMIGFEGAASLPYSGCLALSALEKAGIDESNCEGLRVLIIDGCSPVGCVLTQLINSWGGEVAVTCRARSAPVIKALGAHEIILEHPDSTGSYMELDHLIVKLYESIKTRGFDVIFITKDEYKYKFYRFITEFRIGRVIDTVELDLLSDDYGYFRIKLEKLKKILCSILGRKIKLDDGPHLCHFTLDRLAGYVNDGILQTVVDLVYTPQDASKAVSHICSDRSIGNTIVTFR